MPGVLSFLRFVTCCNISSSTGWWIWHFLTPCNYLWWAWALSNWREITRLKHLQYKRWRIPHGVFTTNEGLRTIASCQMLCRLLLSILTSAQCDSSFPHSRVLKVGRHCLWQRWWTSWLSPSKVQILSHHYWWEFSKKKNIDACGRSGHNVCVSRGALRWL